jgi:drug/metabolite transporter (DMT)-like permease
MGARYGGERERPPRRAPYLGAVSAVLALLASLVWGTSDFVGGLLARRLAVTALVLCSQALGLVVLIAVLSGGGLWVDDGRSILWGAVGGLVGIAALGAFYRGLAVGPMSIVSPVASVGVLIPFAGGLVTGERPQPIQLVGAGLAILGVMVAARPEDPGDASRGHLLPVLLGVASALGFGLVLLAVQEGSKGSVAMTLVSMRAVGVCVLGLATLVLLPTSRRVVGWPHRRDLAGVAVVGTFDLGANALYALAGRGHLLSVAAVLSSLYPAVTALFAWAVLKERLGRVQAAGVAGALAGVVMLASG